MAKKTVFKGVINGEVFDNVTAYNAKMNELIQSGVEDISASSSTEIKNVEDTSSNMNTNLVDEDLSYFPYFENDDPFYLDLLVTSDPVTNQEAFDEAQKVLEKCYRYTVTDINAPEISNNDRQEYLDDVINIIKDIKEDIKDTDSAYEAIAAKRKKLQTEYETQMAKFAADEDILSAASKITSMFLSYYEDIQNEVLTSIKEHSVHEKCNCNGDCGKDCRCSCHNEEVETTCVENQPTVTTTLTDLLEKLFGPDYSIYNK